MSAGATIGRIALMVLSGTATLSLLGAIAETANTGPGNAPPAPSRPGPPVERVTTPDGEWVAVPDPIAPPEPAPPIDETTRWLRAISYALTAIAGFAAATLVVLLRIASALARLSDRDRLH